LRRKEWLDVNRVPLQNVVMTFLSLYPLVDQSKLNGETMRRILAGELHIVKAGKRDKFELWPGKDFLPRLRVWNSKVTFPYVPIPPLEERGGKTMDELREILGVFDILELSAIRDFA
jgi:hypothetical protein